MKKEFSTEWNSSKKPRKQRKYRANAPLHIKRKFLNSHLSSVLIKKYGKRAMALVVGDKVAISRGQFKKREGKIEKVDIRATKVYVTGIDRAKRDGGKSLYPLHPSNLIITELNLSDKKRKEVLERTSKVQTVTLEEPKEK